MARPFLQLSSTLFHTSYFLFTARSNNMQPKGKREMFTPIGTA